jgi:hypothetical protein
MFTKPKIWTHGNMTNTYYNKELGVAITTSKVIREDFTNPTLISGHYYYSHFVLFYFYEEHITHKQILYPVHVCSIT